MANDAVSRFEASVLESTRTVSNQISLLGAKFDSRPASGETSVKVHSQPSVIYTRHDRFRNVIISGIAEDRDYAVWRTQVDHALFIAAGREVQVNDAFRLGKFNPNKTRLILVKLQSRIKLSL